MRVIWTGTYDPEFSRNLKLTRLLELSGTRVRVIREDVWAADRIALAAQPGPRVALIALIRYPKLLWRLLVAPRPDLYLVTYPGWFDVPIVRLVASIKKRLLVFDPFVSLYDTMISDRRLHSSGSLTARLASLIDRWSLRLADLVMADTEPQLDLYEQIAGGLRNPGVVIPIGADEDLFQPRDRTVVEPRMVLYYGKLVPLHGVGTIVEAASLLEPHGVRMVMIGDGPDRPIAEEGIARTEVALERHGMLPLEELPGYVARAAVCLGVFGESEKAGRVIPHKVYEALAMGRPVVTRDGPAVRSMFSADEVVTVPPADPESLAAAIRTLVEDPEHAARVADAGHRAYRERFEETVLAEALGAALQAAAGSRGNLA